ncbi:hypothetical protein Tco_0735396 [Tanacetum coccineum]
MTVRIKSFLMLIGVTAALIDVNAAQSKLLKEFDLLKWDQQWLLEIGDGKVGDVEQNTNGNCSWITIPDEYCIPDNDIGGDVVEVTLWDEMATDFSREEFELMEQLVIFVVSSCKANVYGGIHLPFGAPQN